MVQQMGYFITTYKWSKGLTNFYSKLPITTKLEIFTDQHPEIGKKRIIVDLEIKLNDHLQLDKDRSFVNSCCARSIKTFLPDKPASNFADNIVDNISTKFLQKHLV